MLLYPWQEKLEEFFYCNGHEYYYDCSYEANEHNEHYYICIKCRTCIRFMEDSHNNILLNENKQSWGKLTCKETLFKLLL